LGATACTLANGINVGHGWTIIECQRFLSADKFVSLLLYIWVENHRQNEIHQDSSVSVPASQKQSHSACQIYTERHLLTLKAVAANSFVPFFCQAELPLLKPSSSKWSATMQEEMDPVA
jgi:hypothetical protein